MSLQVWLPLNGDLHNQGLNGDLEFSAINTLTFNNDGKIGKSYQRATNNTQVTTGININSNLLDLLGTEASVAVWVKPLGTHTHYNGTLLSSGNWNAKRWAFGVSQDNSKVDVLCGGYNTYIDCSVPVNQWTHLCSTFDNGISKLYKNGVYIGQLTGRANFDSDAANTCIGRETYANGYFGFNGLINDMRIYDHALSNKEVEEIAKGLILHYKLNDIRQDYSTNLVTSLTAGGQTTVANNVITTSGTNADTYFTINLSENIVEGTSYIISCDAEIPEGKCWTFPLGWQGNTSLSFQIYNGHNVYAFTANSGSWGTKRIFMDDGGSPNSVRSTGVQTKIFNFCVTKSGTISDSSGYNNNGIIIGNINLLTDTSKYTMGTRMNNTGTTNHIECNNELALLTDAITVSLWVKANKSTNQVIFAHPQIEFGLLNNLGYCYPNTNAAGWTLTNFISDQWNHIVVIRQNTTFKLYINGILETQNGAKNNYNHNKNVLWLLNRGNNSSYAGNAAISDVRIYATALTPEQILELYNTSATIDNKGNVYSREYIENNKLNITKTGLFQCNKIYDDDELTVASIVKSTQQVQGNTIYEY